MFRSWSPFVLLLAACGPAVEQPVSEPGSDAGSDTASTGESSPSSASDDETAATAADETTSTGDSGPPSDALPPEAEGDWMCDEFEDPMFIQLHPTMASFPRWAGSVCSVGRDVVRTPYEWTNCDVLGFGHLNLTGTQAYWVYSLDWSWLGVPVVNYEMGVDYVPELDILEGHIFVEQDGMFGTYAQSCTRYVQE